MVPKMRRESHLLPTPHQGINQEASEFRQYGNPRSHTGLDRILQGSISRANTIKTPLIPLLPYHLENSQKSHFTHHPPSGKYDPNYQAQNKLLRLSGITQLQPNQLRTAYQGRILTSGVQRKATWIKYILLTSVFLFTVQW